MNHCYRLVFNQCLQIWQAVAESAKSHRKSGGKSLAKVTLSALFFSAVTYNVGVLAEPNTHALPSGGVVTAGQSTISQNGANLNILQSTQKSIINWASYNIGAGASVNYVQPNAQAISLNRVVGQDPSQIFGKLNANGQVWLINPNGVLFGQSAQVNVGGIVASTLNIADDDFLSGNYKFTGNTGNIVNMGSIVANNGGYVAMLAPEVRNDGIISALEGSSVLAAGDAITLDFNGNNLINVQVDSANINTLVENKNLIKVGGGQVIMSSKAADGLITSVINNSGRIEADSMVADGGTVRLTGAKTAINSGEISAKSSAGKGGTVHMLGENVGVFGAGSINVNGKTGGGTILVGGDFQGNNPNIQNAQKTFVGQNAKLSADATETGDGGKVIVWADDITRYYGNISAKGGSLAGNGGFVEVSGKQVLDFVGGVDVSAAKGLGGFVLLDPQDIVLNTTTQASPPNNANGTPDVAFGDAPAAGTTTIQIADITGYSELFLQATRDIAINNPITMAANNSIRFEADRNITIAAAANIAVSGTGSINLRADANADGAGNLAIGANITSQTGGITLSGANITRTAGNIASTGAAGANGGNISMTATGAITLGAAAVTANGGAAATAGNAGNITISAVTGVSGTGAITATGGASSGASQTGGNGGTVSLSNTGAGVINVGAITASGGNSGTGNAAGGNAGSVTVANSGGNLTTGALTARTGVGIGTGANATAGFITINNTSAAGTIATGAISTAGNTNGAGGNISIAGNNAVTVAGTLSSSGGTSTGLRTGRNAGNVTITGVNRSVTGAITASGGAGVGAAQAGGNAGLVSITGSGTLNTVAITASTGAATTTGAGGTAGSITLSGTTATTGALTTTGGANGNGGNITVTSTTGNVTVGAIASSGGAANAGTAGRNAGSININSAGTVTSTSYAASGTNANGAGLNLAGGNAAAINIAGVGGVTTTTVTASGGAASTTNANGGNAGAITIANSGSANIATTGLTSQGGAGTGTGAGGAAGGVSLTNTAAGGNVTTTGNIATNGNANVNGGNVLISSLGNASVTGTIAASGGTSTGTRAGRNAGNVTITGVNRTVGGAITASGGAGIGTNQAGGNAGVVSITGTGTLSTAAIAASTGARTGTGLGGAAGSITLSGSSVAATALSTAPGTGGAGGNVNVTTTGTATSTITSINATTSGAITLNVNDSLTVSGVVAGTGGTTLTKSGTGTVTLSGANTYTGATNINAGTLVAANNTALGTAAGAATVASGATLALQGGITIAEPLTISGTGVGGGGALRNLNGNNTATGAITLGAGGARINSDAGLLTISGAGNITGAAQPLTVGGAGNTTISKIIATTTGTLTKDGTGTLTLSGANTYTGTTTVSAGTLIAANNNALGAAGGGTTVTSGATLNVNNVILAESALSINGTGVGAAGALTGTGAAVVSGTVASASGSTIGTTSLASALTLNGAVTAAGNLGIVGLGDVTATNAANNFSIVNINGANDVNLRDADAITLGNVASNLTGNLTVQSGGIVTVANNVTTTGGDITLAGTNFVNTAGASALSASGRWLVYANTHTGNTFGGLNSGNQAVWGTAYPTPVAATGNRYVFANSPTVTVTSTNQIKTYGQDGAPIVANAYTATGFIDAATFGNVFTQDTAANALSGSATSTGSAVTANVGSYAIDVTPITATTGYTLTKNTTGNLTVNQAALTIIANNQTKTYGNNFTFLGTEFTNTALQNGETVTNVSLASLGAVNTANVGSYAINGSAATGAGGFNAANYNITYAPGTMTVDPAIINLSGTRTYNGTTSFAAGTFGTINGVLLQTLNITGAGSVTNANVQTAQTLSTGSLALANGSGLASNYTLVGGTHTGTINKRDITAVTGITANNKIYDGNQNAMLNTGAAGFTGLVGGETLTVGSATGTFNSKDVLTANTVNISAIILADGTGLASNYNLTNNTASAVANITTKALTATATVSNKVYDGNNTATPAPILTITAGLVGTETVTATGAGTFNTKDVATANLVTVNSTTLADGTNGGLASNYSLGTGQTAAAIITAKALAVTADNRSKTYGQNIVFAGTEFTNLGLVGIETIGSVSLASAGAINTANVAGGPYAIIASNANGGTFDASNYDITYNAGNLTVNRAPLTIAANNATKAQGAANPAFSSSFSGFVNGESSALLLGLLNHSTAATNISPIGNYAITPFGVAADNYVISFVSGNLAVTAPNTVPPNTVPVLNGAITRPEYLAYGCNTSRSLPMITGLEAYQLSNEDYNTTSNQAEVANVLANGLVNGDCLAL